MDPKYFIFIVAFLQFTSIYCAEEEPQELEESLQLLIEVFRNHGHNFVHEMQSLVPRITEIARAELHVALGSRNVTEEAEEKFIELRKELASYSAVFMNAARKVAGDNKNVIRLRRSANDIKEVMRKRTAFLEADEEHSADLAEDFKDAYQDRLIILSDVLFDNLYNDFHPRKQLFQIFAEKSHQHPVETEEFIHGCFQILTALTILEANYVELKMNTEQATAAFQRKAEKRFNKVLALAAKIIKKQRSRAMMSLQIKEDQKRFHEEWKSLSHCDFARQSEMYFSAKYSDYKFLVISYSTVIGDDKHTISHCIPMFLLFRYRKRNSIIFLIPENYGGVNFFGWARDILDKVPSKVRTKRNRAQTVLKAVKKVAKNCQFGMIFVVTMRASVCYSGPLGYSLETVKSAEVCYTGLCWVKHNYPQRLIVAGRAVYRS